jgi:hypothetical protein
VYTLSGEIVVSCAHLGTSSRSIASPTPRPVVVFYHILPHHHHQGQRHDHQGRQLRDYHCNRRHHYHRLSHALISAPPHGRHRALCAPPLPVVLHLTPYFYNWPVRIWRICRPDGGCGDLLAPVSWSGVIKYPMAAVQSLVFGGAPGELATPTPPILPVARPPCGPRGIRVPIAALPAAPSHALQSISGLNGRVESWRRDKTTTRWPTSRHSHGPRRGKMGGASVAMGTGAANRAN